MKNKLTLGRILTALFLAASLTSFLFGQSRVSIKGTIEDSSGAAVSGASVSIAQSDHRYVRENVTGPDGTFQFSNLAPGRYLLSISARTFAAVNRELDLPQEDELRIVLAAGPVAAEVTVSSAYLAGTTESLAELPGAIERLNKFELENGRMFNFSEALRRISGINIKDEEGFGLRPNIGIRGTNPTRSTKVLLLEDGVPLAYAPYGDNASYYHPPLERYESIEVLKGSGQIAYGPQTIAGLVNYITPNPTDKPSLSLRAAAGNRKYFNGSVAGSGKFHKTGIFANYTRKQGDGARENIGSELNDVFVKTVQTLNSRNAVSLKFSYFGEDSNVTYSGLTEAEFAADPRSNPFRNDRFFGDRLGASASHTAVISPDLVLHTNVYANRFKRHWWRQSSNSGQRPNRLNVDPDCLSMADLNTTCGNEGRLREYGTYGVEPRITFTYDGGTLFRGELQAGVRGHWEIQDRRQVNGDLPNSRTGATVELNERRNDAYSGFVQNRFVIGHLAITPGIRFERIRIERTNRLASPAARGETIINEVIPGVGVAYSGLPRTTVFAGVHRGFSPPRAEDIISNTGGVVELDSELSWNYEAGVRTDPISGLRIEGAFFRLDHQNQIVPASLAGGVGATLTNGGQTLQQGLEVSGHFDSGVVFESRHNFYLRAAYTWLPTAEFRGVRFSSVTPSVPITGNRLPYVPGSTITASVGYSHTNGFDAFLENVYLGRQFGDDLNTINPTANGQRGAIPAQTYWNATANYKVEKLKTTFFVTAKNIFGRTFIVDRGRGILPSIRQLIQAGVHVRF